MAETRSRTESECWEEVSLPSELKLSNVEKTMEANDDEKKGNFSEQKTKVHVCSCLISSTALRQSNLVYKKTPFLIL